MVARFTIALAKLGAGHVTGVDLGEDGLEIACSLAASEGIKNVKFEKESVLNLPYKDKSFDFVFCKKKHFRNHTRSTQLAKIRRFRMVPTPYPSTKTIVVEVENHHFCSNALCSFMRHHRN